MKENGSWTVCEAFDGNKDVSELVFFRQANGIAAHYEYAPFGGVTATNSATPVTSHDFIALNPLRFSSEFADDTLGLVYYNYRHYEPVAGRWLTREPGIDFEFEDDNPYDFIGNNPVDFIDELGLRRGRVYGRRRRGRRGKQQQIKPKVIRPDAGGECPEKCCNGKMVKLDPIWNCKRTLEWSEGSTTRPISWYHSITALYHQYVCCDGPNSDYCLGVRDDLKKDDMIKKEKHTTGTCEMRCVCPNEKGKVCSKDNPPTMPEDYGIGPFWMDCQEWADGATSSCAR